MEDETRQKQHVARNSKGRISMKMALRITGQMTGWHCANRSCHDAPSPEVTITPCALTFFIVASRLQSSRSRLRCNALHEDSYFA